MASASTGHVALAFGVAARRYWLSIFPRVRRELRYWHQRAEQIPDPALRGHALATHRRKRGHSEGAAAFATLVAPARRAGAIRLMVAFQAMYDYLDTVSERPCDDYVANNLQLHRALVVALDPSAAHEDYYAFNGEWADGGYLRELVDVCRSGCGELPAHPRVADRLRTATTRAMQSQAYTHSAAQTRSDRALAAWAAAQAPGSELHWWEVASASGSSLVIHALLAAATDPALSLREVDATEALYFPWVGALQGLMDSLIDQVEDECDGYLSHVTRYRSTDETARRMGAIASRSLSLTRGLAAHDQHAVVIAGMVSLFASACEARLPTANGARRSVIEAMGAQITLPLLVLRLRRRLGAKNGG